jgi:hypothetical protein
MLHRPVRLSVSLTLLVNLAAAQTGPFVDGELLVRAPNAANAMTLFRIDPNTGQGASLLSSIAAWGGGPASMVFDSYRGGVLANMALPPDIFRYKLWLVRSDGTASSIPALDTMSLRALTPTGDGRVYFQEHAAAPLTIRYLDAANTLQTLMDASGTAPFVFGVQRMIYHAPSNALIALSGIGSPNDCQPNQNSIHRFPLSVDGRRVVGPVTCASFGSAYEYANGIDVTPAGNLFVTISSGYIYPDKLVTIHPVSLAMSVYSQVNPHDLNGGCYSERIGRAIVLEDTANELRTFGPGQGGNGTLLPCNVPVGDGSTGSGWDETMIELDVNGPTCHGLAYGYGAGLAGTGGVVPALAAIGCPRLSQSFTVALDRAVGGAPGLFLVGAQSVSVPVVGGTLHVLPIFTLPLLCNGLAGAAGAGGAGMPLLVTDPSLLGATVYFQAALIDLGAVQSIALSNGLQIVIG